MNRFRVLGDPLAMSGQRNVSAAIRRERDLQAIARRQHGLVTVEQLYALGFSSAAISRRVACGRLHRIHRGVYAVGRREITREGVFLAAALAIGDGAVLGGFAAAALWGFWNGNTAPIEVVVARRTRPRVGLLVHRVDDLPASAITRHLGIPVTTPVRTIFDLAGTIRLDRVFRRVVHEAFVQKRISLRALQEEIDRSDPRRRGVARVMAEIATGAKPTRSWLEDALVEILRRADVPPFETNARVPGTPSWVEVDAWFSEHRLAVEIDGKRFHSTPYRLELDAYKQELVKRAGHRMIRLPEEAVAPAREPDTIALIQGATSARPTTSPAGGGR